MSVLIDRMGEITVVTIDRPERRNAVDGGTAGELDQAFAAFDHDPGQRVAILTGAGGQFCAGADLQALAALPQQCLRNDRRSTLDQRRLGEADALRHEADIGLATLATGEAEQGAARFAAGQGRSGGALED